MQMLLAIDVGNTNTVVALYEGEKMRRHWRMATDKNRASDEIGMLLLQFLGTERAGAEDIEAVMISSVVPPFMHSLTNAVRRYLDCEPMLIGPGVKTGMNILMDNPKSVGSDMIVDVVAAIHEHPLPLVVIDMGTATTLSVADKKGNYIGGVILPGLRVSLNSLSGKTAQLPYISLEVPNKVIGKNTIDCMRAGIIFSNVDMIDGILDRMEKELGETPTVIATGGLARFITPLCRHEIIFDDALLLKGLLILYRKNTQ